MYISPVQNNYSRVQNSYKSQKVQNKNCSFKGYQECFMEAFTKMYKDCYEAEETFIKLYKAARAEFKPLNEDLTLNLMALGCFDSEDRHTRFHNKLSQIFNSYNRMPQPVEILDDEKCIYCKGDGMIFHLGVPKTKSYMDIVFSLNEQNKATVDIECSDVYGGKSFKFYHMRNPILEEYKMWDGEGLAAYSETTQYNMDGSVKTFGDKVKDWWNSF